MQLVLAVMFTGTNCFNTPDEHGVFLSILSLFSRVRVLDISRNTCVFCERVMSKSYVYKEYSINVKTSLFIVELLSVH